MSENTFNLGTVLADAVKVITDPMGFYREMPTEGGYAQPLIFVVVMAVITGLLMSIYAVLGLGVNSTFAGGMAMAAVILFPIAAVIGSFIGAAIMFVIWKLMGSEKDYETAYRCVAYSFVTMPVATFLSFIPYFSSIIKSLWSAFLMYAASVGAHNIKAQTAKIVFGVLAAIGIFLTVSAERAERKWRSYGEEISSELEKSKVFKNLENMENIEDMTAEEAGKQVGEFLKGLESFSKGLEESVKEQEAEAESAED